MKNFYQLIAALLFLSFAVFAQNPVTNPGFESWAGSTPTDWMTSNITGVVNNITQSSDAHSGSFAARGEVANFSGVPLPPTLLTQPGGNPNGQVPITQNYEMLTGYYKLEAQGDAAILASVEIWNGNSILGTGSEILSPVSAYTAFSVPINYSQSGTGSGARITFTTIGASGGQPGIGSVWHIDDIELTGLVAIEPLNDGVIPTEHRLEQNYPNPFNPNTTIEFSLNKSTNVQLTIFNALGQEVARLADEVLAAGSYRIDWNAENLPAGTYFYQLQTGDFRQTKKMVLAK